MLRFVSFKHISHVRRYENNYGLVDYSIALPDRSFVDVEPKRIEANSPLDIKASKYLGKHSHFIVYIEPDLSTLKTETWFIPNSDRIMYTTNSHIGLSGGWRSRRLIKLIDNGY